MPAVVTVIAIAVASNLDNAGVGIAYGVRKIRFSWWSNLIISVISGMATLVAGTAGSIVTHYLPANFTGILGAAVMIAVGLWVISEPWRDRRRSRRRLDENHMVRKILRDPAYADFDNSKSISFHESLVLGFALALNALAGGFDAGVVHIGVGWTTLAVTVASFVLLAVSDYVGRRYASRLFGSRATYIAGLLLIAIGIYQLY